MTDAQSAQQKKPNIIFILLDNVGWGNFGVYGGTIPTPRIDQFANEGIRFTNYNVEVQCTPSRSAILTGRHPVRSGTLRVPYPGEGLSGLAPWEYTIAELLSPAGDRPPGFRRQVPPARRAVRRHHRRGGLPRRADPGRGQGSGRRRQYDRHPQQRQRGRRSYPAGRARLERALARRFPEHAVRGKYAGARHNPLAG